MELLASKLEGRIEVRREYGDLPLFPAHAPQLNQALWEILSNAVESIDGTGTVTLGARRESGGILITIADTGRGIPAAELDQLFEPRLRPKNNRVGVSLGLPLAHKIVHDHGGRLEIASSPGRGTTVSLRLPLP